MCRPPGRPKSIFDDFGIDFGLILASRFHQNFDLFRKLPKSRFYWKNNEKSMIFHPRGLPFPPRFLIKFSRSFRTPLKTYFFRPSIARGHQKGSRIDFFGPLLAPGPISRGPKNHPKSIFNIKNHQNGSGKFTDRSIFGDPRIDLLPRSLSDRSSGSFL